MNNYNIFNCTFSNNFAPNFGSAIQNTDIASAYIVNSTFSNNFCNRSGTISSRGKLIIENSLFSSNFANNYGGAVWSSTATANTTINNSTFISNSASHGGAIYAEANSALYINNCAFDNNSNPLFLNDGGAIYNINSICIINSSNFTNNTSDGSGAGGAIYNNNGILNITNSAFINNSATFANGGAICNTGQGNVSINNTFFNNNSAENVGGAIFNWGNLLINNSNFTNNNASSHGGAIFSLVSGNDGSNLTVISVQFINNTSNSNGGGIYNLGILNTTLSEFINNSAVNGGAIYSNSINAIVTSSEFNSNNANTGGVIYNAGNMTVSNNSMNNNTANLGKMIYNSGIMGILNLTYLNNSTKIVFNGQNIELFANLTDDMGNTVTGQNITFFVNGVFIGSAESIEGYANLTYLVSGSLGDLLPVNGSYEGIGDYPINIKNGLLKIQLATNSTIIAPDTKVGKTTTISGVAKANDGSVLANIELTVTVGSNSYNVMTNGNGEWSLDFTPTTSGEFSVTVSWLGNSTHQGFINSTTFNVNKLKTSITVVAHDTKLGQNTVISGVLIDEDGNPIANAQIIVTVDGKKYTVTTDDQGSWKLTYKATHKGTIQVLVNFEGDDIYFSSENSTTFTVLATTNNTNNTNGTNNNLVATSAAMKKTGMPIIAIFLVLLSSLGLIFKRKL